MDTLFVFDEEQFLEHIIKYNIDDVKKIIRHIDRRNKQKIYCKKDAGNKNKIITRIPSTNTNDNTMTPLQISVPLSHYFPNNNNNNNISDNYNIMVTAVNYNFLKITSGMASIVYS